MKLRGIAAVLALVLAGCGGKSSVALGSDPLASPDTDSPGSALQQVSDQQGQDNATGTVPAEAEDQASQSGNAAADSSAPASVPPVTAPVLSPDTITQDELEAVFGQSFEKVSAMDAFRSIFKRGIDGYTFVATLTSRLELQQAVEAAPQDIRQYANAIYSLWDEKKEA